MNLTRDEHWKWMVSFDRGFDFLVDILVSTGLTVRPFDRHSPTGVRLRVPALTSQVWSKWLDRYAREIARMPPGDEINPLGYEFLTEELRSS